MSLFNPLKNIFKSSNEEKNLQLFTSFFSINDTPISSFITSEEDAKWQIKRIDDLLNLDGGFYNDYSVFRDSRILHYISLKYPTLCKSTSFLLKKFEKQNIDVYNRFVDSDKNIENKFTIGGIISDLFKIEDDYITLLDILHNLNLNPSDDSYEEVKSNHIKVTKEFLLRDIYFTEKNKVVEILTNYDMVCWYYVNFIKENPQLQTSNTKEKLEEMSKLPKETLPLFKERIKERYGVG